MSMTDKQWKYCKRACKFVVEETKKLQAGIDEKFDTNFQIDIILMREVIDVRKKLDDVINTMILRLNTFRDENAEPDL